VQEGDSKLNSSGASTSLSCDSAAKVNLSLRVLGRLRSGMHLISSIVCPISLADRLSVEVRPELGGQTISVSFDADLDAHLRACAKADPQLAMHVQELSGVRNLALRAAALFLSTIGDPERRVHVTIEKRVPLGAGLGGGSANAASTLLLLNRSFGEPLAEKDLLKLAAQIGSDVPAALIGGLVLMTGTGDHVYPVQSPVRIRAHLLLMKPAVSVNTEWAYAKLGMTPSIEPEQARQLCVETARNEPHLRGLGLDVKAAATGDNWLTLLPQAGISDTPDWDAQRSGISTFVNDFQPVISREVPEMKRAESLLTASGSFRVLLCGSGSSVLGFFESEAKRDFGLEYLKREAPQGWLAAPVELRPEGSSLRG